MLILMHSQSTPEQIEKVKNRISALNLTPHVIPGQLRCAIGITGNKGAISPDIFKSLPGVVQCIPVTKPYKLISREVRQEDTVIDVNGAKIGGRDLTIIAGPCAVENEQQIMTIAEQLSGMGVKFLRGGAFKPRTSPYSFQGLGEAGLKLLAKARDSFGMRLVSEVIDVETLPLVAEYVDVIQIGARNMYNYSLLKNVGQLTKPVLLKRGLSATLEEFLMAAEYIVSHGNFNVILCERGIRTFSDFSRNTLDMNVVPTVKQISHLPIIVDPSHASGDRKTVIPLARGAVAVGADGVIIEVHPDPENAVSDGPQSLYPMQFQQLLGQLNELGRFRLSE
ncbi:3-deoxy-7-phosphoheptulonate synthase [candidate division KSB1 bacterium]|nr:3-deoxy-7-phosphoheptulonate synthase [candidate division KSB1 bacterium]